MEWSHSSESPTKVLVDLLTAIKKVVSSEIKPNLRLPKAFIELQRPTFIAQWDRHLSQFRNNEIDPRLMEIAFIPYQNFIEVSGNLYWGNYTWLKIYHAKLSSIDWKNNDCSSKTEALVSLLISVNLNHDQFIIYCKGMIESRTALKTGRSPKMRELAKCRKIIIQDARSKTPAFLYHMDSVVDQLTVWITAEKEFVDKNEPEDPVYKLHFNIPVYLVAFLFKMFHEQKLFGDMPYRLLTEQVASTCVALGGKRVKRNTLQSKTYQKDLKSLLWLEALLVKMLEYIRQFLPKK